MMTATALLETRNLTKSFSGRTVIDHLCLNVMAGDVYGFLGRNGQGKTTTIRLLTGLIFPDSGDVIIDGHSLRNDFKKAMQIKDHPWVCNSLVNITHREKFINGKN